MEFKITISSISSSMASQSSANESSEPSSTTEQGNFVTHTFEHEPEPRDSSPVEKHTQTRSRDGREQEKDCRRRSERLQMQSIRNNVPCPPHKEAPFLEKSKQELQAELDDMKLQRDDQKARLRESEHKRTRGQVKLRGCQQALRKKEAEFIKAMHTISELETMAQGRRARDHQLQQILFKDTTADKVNDSDLTFSFSVLKQKLLSVVHSRLIDLDMADDYVLFKASKASGTLGDKLRSSDRSLRPMVLQAELYDVIHRQILTVNFFGLGQYSHPMNDMTGIPRSAERLLRVIENCFSQRNVGEETVVDWRLSTIKCIELSGLTTTEEKQTVRLIQNTLKSLCHRTATLEDLDALDDTITELCEAACQLRLLMRRSKDIYSCEILDAGTDWTDRVDKMAEIYHERNSHHSGCRVLNTLFGALIKHAKFRGEDPVVLQKAQVVVERGA